MSREPIAEHYEQLIGLVRPWRVARVEISHAEQEVRIHVERDARPRLRCPECEAPCGGYDSRECRWRHLDTMQYRTILIAEVPRVRCAKHGVRQIAVPWSEPSSRFTALFEALVIDWLREASFAAVARLLRLGWAQVAGIQERAVQRGLARRADVRPKRIGVDETSFRRRHEYVTVVNDLAGRVLHVGDDRKQETLDAFFAGLGEAGCRQLEVVAMDMWAPYIASTRQHVPEADEKIVYDKFHVAKHLGDAVDRVRRRENRELRAVGDERLVRTKYAWLQNPDRMSLRQWQEFEPLRTSRLRVARAWAIRSRFDPVKRVAKMIQTHWQGDQRGHERRDQRARRRAQQQDPVDQTTGLRLPQSRSLPQRHLLPPRRVEPLPAEPQTHFRQFV